MTTLDEDEHRSRRGLLDGLRSGAWLDSQTFPPIEWAVPGLVPEGASLLVGGPKLGKSWLVLNVALAVAAGGSALGVIPVKQRPVLYLALEDGDRRLQDRCRTLLDASPIPPSFYYMTATEPGMVEATIAAWVATLEAEACPLVVLDTLGRVMPPALPGESAYARDYRIAGRLKHLADARPGMALVVVHHDRKAATDDFVESASGTNGIAGAMDTILVLSRKRGEVAGLLKVTGREVDEAEYGVTMDGGCWRLDGRDLSAAAAAAAVVRETINLGDRSADIVRFASRHPDGFRAADVAVELDLSADDLRRYLNRLAETGKVRKLGRGLFAPLLTPVPSVPSVPFGADVDTERDRPDERDTSLGVPCSACGFPLDPVLAAAGETTHPTCVGAL